MDATDAHRKLIEATGGTQAALAGRAVTGVGSPIVVHPAAVNGIAAAFGNAMASLETFVAGVRELLDALGELVDDDGREIWMRAGEVELDQWAGRVILARDAVRRDLGSRPT